MPNGFHFVIQSSRARQRFEQCNKRRAVRGLSMNDEPEAGSVELSPNITVELNDKGEMIGIEILGASSFIRDSIMESVPARVLRVSELQPV
ncbi:MAG: DUF2283 domain-containing protein [Chloroflexi bacterium]|nr:DUF2283 domain-containing protein [Chloroflexota bacterium]